MGESIEFYCVKCRAKVSVDADSITKETTANKRKMLRSKCPECGTKVCKFIPSKKEK